MNDNYWSMGIPGPCGPCSEIYYDRGPEYGVEGGPEADEDRYIEIWNLVFMQNERGDGTSKDDFEILGPLPKKNIDTGMGVERVAFLLAGRRQRLRDRPPASRSSTKAEELTGRMYGADHDDDVRFRVIADHARTAAMLIADGVNPGNDGRGYVLRRLLRRIVRSAQTARREQPTMREFIIVVRDTMAPSYPVLDTDFDAHRDCRGRGGDRVPQDSRHPARSCSRTPPRRSSRPASRSIAGDQAFALHDTYGFPIDLTLEMASEAGLTVDEDGFRTLMAEQRKRAKDDAQARKHAHADLTVYKELARSRSHRVHRIQRIGLRGTRPRADLDGVRVPVATAGQDVEVILDRSPLYAESGGQIADIGSLTGPGLGSRSTTFRRSPRRCGRTRSPSQKGQITEGDIVLAHVDAEWRKGATQGHSGTHMVHAALRQVLGPNAVQAGSLNKPGYLRFDFSWQGALSESQKQDIEVVTNEAVASNYAVNTFVTDSNTISQAVPAATTGRVRIALLSPMTGDAPRAQNASA